MTPQNDGTQATDDAVWVAVNLEEGFEWPQFYGPFATSDAAKAYCTEQEWEQWGAYRVDKPEHPENCKGGCCLG